MYLIIVCNLFFCDLYSQRPGAPEGGTVEQGKAEMHVSLKLGPTSETSSICQTHGQLLWPDAPPHPPTQHQPQKQSPLKQQHCCAAV